jgi:multidrug efflux system outer membrane protein
MGMATRTATTNWEEKTTGMSTTHAGPAARDVRPLVAETPESACQNIRPNPRGARVFLVLATAVSGCTVGKNYAPPQTRTPATWGELEPTGAATGPATRPSTAAPPVEQWWTTFGDPDLDALIGRAMKSNLDLRRARARVVEARAQLRVTRADLFPGVNTSGSYTRSRNAVSGLGGGTFSDGTGGTGGGGTGGGGGGGGGGFVIPGFGSNSNEQDFFQAGFDASWEIDVFGGNRRAVEAANADIAAAVEDQRDVLVTLLAEVARNYVDLRGFQRQIAVARENLQAQQQTLELTRNRLRGGVSTELDVAQAQAQVATTASQIPTLEAGARQAIHRLGVLAGAHPMTLAAELSPPKAIPQPPPEVPVGMPSELLRRRPDIRRAERQLAATVARVGSATADLFPKFSLTGSLGLQSSKFTNLFEWGSRFWSIGPSVSWPIFDAGRIRGNIAVQNAREEQAVATYEQSVLTALQEVEDALVNYAKEESRRRTLADAADANRRAVDLANQLYAAGRTDFLSVLQAQRDLYASQDALIQSTRSVSTNLITLYKSLGGGWQVEQQSENASR